MFRRAIRRLGWAGVTQWMKYSWLIWQAQDNSGCALRRLIYCTTVQFGTEKTCCGSVLRNRGTEQEDWVFTVCQSPEHHHNNSIFIQLSGVFPRGASGLLCTDVRCCLRGSAGVCFDCAVGVLSLSELGPQIIFSKSQHCGDFPPSLHWGSIDSDQLELLTFIYLNSGY